MTVWVSCRFHGENGPERHEEISEYLYNISSNFWHDTTSFYIIETSTPRSNIISRIHSIIRKDLGDTVVIGSNEYLGVTVIGEIHDSSLGTWMSNFTYKP